MQAKTIVALIGALVPVLYCAGLLYYFIDKSGSVENAEAIGLGPTMLGLLLVGLVFCIPLVWRAVRMFSGPRASGPTSSGPSSKGPGEGSDPVTKAPAPKRDNKREGEDEGDIGAAADAAIARYMAKKAAEANGSGGGAPAPSTRPSGFGHRTG